MTDIFNEYAKIAIEQGLISEADTETNQRYDTKTLSDIELLYGIKLNDQKPDENIHDKAYKPIGIVDCYDRANGLGKTPQQSQAIGIGITRKHQNGLLDNHRYATQVENVAKANNDLLNEVIKTAFWADKENEKELMILADSCAERLVKKADAAGAAGLYGGTAAVGVGAAMLLPLASMGWLLPIVGAVAGIAMAVHYFSDPKTQGLKKDAERTLNEINSLSDDEKEKISPFINVLSKLKDMADNYISTNDNLTKMLLTIASASNDDEKKLAIAKNAASYIQSGQDKVVIEINKKVSELSSGIVNSTPQVIDILQKMDQDNKSNKPGVEFYRAHIRDTSYVSVIKEIQVLSETCSGISTYTSELTGKLAKLRDVVSSAGSLSSSKPGEAKKEEAAKKDEIPSYVPPSWA